MKLNLIHSSLISADEQLGQVKVKGKTIRRHLNKLRPSVYELHRPKCTCINTTRMMWEVSNQADRYPRSQKASDYPCSPWKRFVNLQISLLRLRQSEVLLTVQVNGSFPESL